jgi:hypothetical protein
MTDEAWSESRGSKIKVDDHGYDIPLETRQGFSGRLRLTPSEWV